MATKIRRFVSPGLFLLLVFMFAFTSMQVSAKGVIPEAQSGAQEVPPTPTPLPEIHTFTDNITFTLGDLGEQTFALYYPSAYTFTFSMPNQWTLYTTSGAGYMDIHYDLYEDWSATAAQPALTYNNVYRTYGPDRPYLDVVINDVLAGSFTPVVGKDQIARIEIPSDVVVGRYTNNPYNDFTVEIQYYGNRDNFCYYDGTIKIYDDSQIHFGFVPLNPQRNVAEFPRPLVQDSFLPETIQIVIPDNFNQADLEALASVSSAVGGGTYGNVNLNVLKASEATPEVIKNHSVIVIGQPKNNSFLLSLYQRQMLPTGLTGNNIIQYGGETLSDEDGVLQEMQSEFNPTYTYFVVTGSSDEAVLRAAKALTLMPIGIEGNLLVVKSDGPEQVVVETPFVRTFAQFGFTSRTFYGLGVRSAFLTFYVPRDWIIQDGTSIDLVYAFSDKLSTSNSSFTIELNGNKIGTVPIELNMPGEQVFRVPLRKEDIEVGAANYLRFENVLQSELDCASFDYRANWFNVRETSQLNLPYKVIENLDLLPAFSHPSYYLIYEPGVLVSMPASPTNDEVNGLANLGFLVGAQNPSPADIMVSTDPNLDLESHADRNIVLFGRPTANPLIAQLNDMVPQPFVTGEDALKQRIGGVPYRLSQDVDLGMVEVIPAPWNKLKGITIVTGTSDKGVSMALASFTNSDALFDLSGDLLFATGTEILSFPTTEEVPELLDTLAQEALTATGAGLEAVAQTPQSSTSEQPDRYVSPEAVGNNMVGTIALIGLVGVGVVLAILGIVKTTRGGRKS
ncbi:MAG: cellulose biosynthesis cyclic di-GMP-binding regulatory protein BcsB [Anaerolineaceae bacterium]|nr:cellulose biosynthesis cyclic di-GMP-binding regulatory protein BcsB [Anaerolineaceae bacterium]